MIFIAPHPVLLHHTDRVSLGPEACTDGVQCLDSCPEELERDRLEHVVLVQDVNTENKTVIPKKISR